MNRFVIDGQLTDAFSFGTISRGTPVANFVVVVHKEEGEGADSTPVTSYGKQKRPISGTFGANLRSPSSYGSPVGRGRQFRC